MDITLHGHTECNNEAIKCCSRQLTHKAPRYRAGETHISGRKYLGQFLSSLESVSSTLPTLRLCTTVYGISSYQAGSYTGEEETSHYEGPMQTKGNINAGTITLRLLVDMTQKSHSICKRLCEYQDGQPVYYQNTPAHPVSLSSSFSYRHLAPSSFNGFSVAQLSYVPDHYHIKLLLYPSRCAIQHLKGTHGGRLATESQIK